MSDKKENTELEVVQTEGIETEENPNLFQLRKPIDRMGTAIHSLILDFDSLLLEDMLAAERDFEKMVGPQTVAQTPVKAFNTAYQMAVAARASGIPVEFFKGMSARDASSIGLRVQGFLLGGE